MSAPKRILILTSGPVWYPRVWKEATALSEAGYDVTVLACLYDEAGAELDRQVMATASWKGRYWLDLRQRSSLHTRLARLEKRLATEAVARLGIESPRALGYCIKEMAHQAIAEYADLTVVHLEPAIWVGQQLLRKGCKVGIDMEDWYSEDLLPSDRSRRPLKLLRSLESQLLSKCRYVTTTSEAMAQALATQYKVPKPVAIYNSFPNVLGHESTGPADRADYSLPSVHWFSQTIGAGRGLESLFEALRFVKAPMQLHLRGKLTEASRGWVAHQLQSVPGIQWYLHDLVTHTQLAHRIAEHDIGLALEESESRRNKEFTVSNKMFQYLQAGLAVIATDTAGQQEVARQVPDAFKIVPQNNPAKLAEALNNLLNDRQGLQHMKCAAEEGFERYFSWPSQAIKIQTLAANALNEEVSI